MEWKDYDWTGTFPDEGEACNQPDSSQIRTAGYTHGTPPRAPDGSRILATVGDPLPITFKNAANAYWSMCAPAKRDSALDVRVAVASAAKPGTLIAQSVTQCEYDNPQTTGNVTRQLHWNSALLPSVPPVAVTAVTLSGASDSAVMQHSYATKGSHLGKGELAMSADALKKETEAARAGTFVGKNGTKYVVSTSVTTSIVDSESAAIKSGADNVVGIARGDAMSGGITSYVEDRHLKPFSSSDRGVFSFEALTAGRNTGAHEMGHFWGGRDLFAGNAIMNKDPHSRSARMTFVDFNRVLWPVVSKRTGTRTVRAVWSARLGF